MSKDKNGKYIYLLGTSDEKSFKIGITDNLNDRLITHKGTNERIPRFYIYATKLQNPKLSYRKEQSLLSIFQKTKNRGEDYRSNEHIDAKYIEDVIIILNSFDGETIIDNFNNSSDLNLEQKNVLDELKNLSDRETVVLHKKIKKNRNKYLKPENKIDRNKDLKPKQINQEKKSTESVDDSEVNKNDFISLHEFNATRTTIKSYKFKEKQYKFDNVTWKDFQTIICKKLYEINPDIIESKNKEDLHSPEEIAKNVYIEGNRSAEYIRKNLIKLLEKYDLENQLKVKLK